MTESNSEELYGKDHEPDPVTKGAVEAAMAATEPEHHHSPWWQRISYMFLAALMVIAVGSGVVTSINTVQNSRQNDKLATQNKQLQDEQKCVTTLIQSFEQDQSARVTIAKDDRDVVDDFIQALLKAKTPAEGQAAITAYNKRRNENEARRQALPAVVPSCGINFGSLKPNSITPSLPTPSPTASPKPTK